jgi:predicted enzyme related to lactoylglutathione lyase
VVGRELCAKGSATASATLKLHSPLKSRKQSAFEETTVAREFQSSRDVIIRTSAWAEATEFYSSILGLPVTQRSATLMDFETGSFCLYVEKGKEHGPVFDFLVSDVQAQKRRLVAAGCTVLEENASIPRCYIRDPFGLVFNIGHAE